MMTDNQKKPDLSGLTVTKSGQVVKEEKVVMSKERYFELVKNDILYSAILEGFDSMKSDPDPQVRDFAQKANVVVLTAQKLVKIVIASAEGVK